MVRKTSPKKPLHAYYSPTIDAKYGHCVFMVGENQAKISVVITEKVESFKQWPDMIYLGEVYLSNFVEKKWHSNKFNQSTLEGIQHDSL